MWINRLDPESPGTIDGPECPPRSAAAFWSSRRQLIWFAGPWQAEQRCSKIGRTCASKSTAPLAAGGATHVEKLDDVVPAGAPDDVRELSLAEIRDDLLEEFAAFIDIYDDDVTMVVLDI